MHMLTMYSVRVATITGNNETSILKNCTILICTVNSSDTNFRQWANYVTGSWKTYLWAQANFEKTQLKIIIIFSNKVFSLQIWIKQLLSLLAMKFHSDWILKNLPFGHKQTLRKLN